MGTPAIAAAGVKATAQDPSVLDWTYSKTKPGVVLGEPEDTRAQGTGSGKWPNQSDVEKHPGFVSDLQRNPQGTAAHPAFSASTSQARVRRDRRAGQGPAGHPVQPRRRPARVSDPASPHRQPASVQPARPLRLAVTR